MYFLIVKKVGFQINISYVCAIQKEALIPYGFKCIIVFVYSKTEYRFANLC